MDIKAVKDKLVEKLFNTDLEKMSYSDLRFFVDIVRATAEIRTDENERYINMLQEMMKMLNQKPEPQGEYAIAQAAETEDGGEAHES